MVSMRWQPLIVAAAMTFALPAALAAQTGATGLAIEANQAKKGQGLWNSRGCTGCHTVGGGKRSGPDLAGVLERRDLGWLRRWLKNPTEMLESDSLAKAMLAEYNNTKMPNMRLKDEDIEALLHFIGQETERRRPTTTSP